MLMLKSNRPLPDQIVPPTLKHIRDAGGFTGVNPPMLKLAQGVYEKTRFGAWQNCRDFVRSCPLSLGDELLVGLYSLHSTEEIRLRVRDEDIAKLHVNECVAMELKETKLKSPEAGNTGSEQSKKGRQFR
ncbi:hypothetical protein WN944_022286 [Citrus x changshan-huyou]|uniref:Uncharacterized protein n=1 Tax=Citrus x changshan-huyou TaxID=2935761 RepID=A0AAP0N4C3_9ROSI